MKVVIADASPLNYLILIGEVQLLPRLFGEILVPDVVVSELGDPEAPRPVRAWASHPPSWLTIRPTPASSESIERLDEGERAAILLAEAQEAPVLLIIDDAEGRAEAGRRRIAVRERWACFGQPQSATWWILLSLWIASAIRTSGPRPS